MGITRPCMKFQKSYHFGDTRMGLSISAYSFGHKGPEVLILGGVHGDETEGVIAANGLLRVFDQSFPFQLKVTLVPMFNLDGILKNQRRNAHNVDLNRNLPTTDWSPEAIKERYNPGPFAGSEPENQALIKYLKDKKPIFIITLHSWENPMLNTNGDCQAVAKTISAHTKYKITSDIGYPTPGSLGCYCGLERQIPTITYELERGLCSKTILKNHVPAILEGLKVLES